VELYVCLRTVVLLKQYLFHEISAYKYSNIYTSLPTSRKSFTTYKVSCLFWLHLKINNLFTMKLDNTIRVTQVQQKAWNISTLRLIFLPWRFTTYVLLHLFCTLFVSFVFVTKLYDFITLKKTQCKENWSVIDGEMVSVHASCMLKCHEINIV
jgi:hypothetical protein